MLITTEQLKGVLSVRKGARFVTIIAETRVKLCTTHFGKVTKRSRVNGVIGFSYSNSVNRQRGRECERPSDFELFVAQPRTWGTRLEGLPFVEYKGRFYLEVKVERSLGYNYFDGAGNEIATDEIEPYLLPWRASRTQDLEKEVILRDYSLANILEVTADGVRYEIERVVNFEPEKVLFEYGLNDPISLFCNAVDEMFEGD
jgi:hypothetical protein